MRPGQSEMDPVKLEGRQPLNRRKIAKKAPLFNGAVSLAAAPPDDEHIVRQVNLAAAFHDHISCTKSAELCKVAGAKDAKVKVKLGRRDRQMCHLRKRVAKSDDDSTDNISDIGSTVSDSNALASTSCVPNGQPTAAAPVLVTRYLGRKSRTVPLRALKRRYLGPPKSLRLRKPAAKSVSSTASHSSTSEPPEEDTTKRKMKSPPLIDEKPSTSRNRVQKKKVFKLRGHKEYEYVTTDTPYFLTDNHDIPSSPVSCERLIDVPSWRLKPVTSYYQMEGTENITDAAFERRHVKYEQDERRRKRWDLQRLREQRKHTQYVDNGRENDPLKKKYSSFYPDPSNIQYIEVTDKLPVLAFGYPIALFQPSEFSLPWKVGENKTIEPTPENPPLKGRRKRKSSSSGPKVT